MIGCYSIQKEKHQFTLIIQVYVDDIVFKSFNENLCVEFYEIMKKKFELSMMT